MECRAVQAPGRRFRLGWAAREWGRKCRAVGFVERSFDAPLWLGDAPIAGKTILLHSDEGLGDTIHFARYVPMLAAAGRARASSRSMRRCSRCFRGIDGVAQCLPKTRRRAARRSTFIVRCRACRSPLPRGSRPSRPRRPICRAPERTRCGPGRQRLGAQTAAGRPGLVRQSGAHQRPQPLDAVRLLAPLLDLDATFVSLQKDPRPADRALLERTRRSSISPPISTDFAETAALISCLDLVITVDTSVAHLAGALGTPTWILLPYTPDYRWLLGRDDSPWYPSVRLFRQDDSCDYTPVVARIRAALSAELAAFAR